MRVLPAGIASTPQGGEVAVELTDVRCDLYTVVSDPQPAPSSYVSGYQQLANPRYAQIQAQLQQAQAALSRLQLQKALSPPLPIPMQGNSAEVAAQMQVNMWANLLAVTPPYLSQPITTPYAVYRYEAKKNAAISAQVSLQDSVTGFADVLPIRASAEVSGDGVRGVMAGDQGGFRDREPSLEPDVRVLEQAVGKLASVAASGLRVLGERSFIQRAIFMTAGKRDARVVVGNLLLAADFQADPSELAAFQPVLRGASELPLEKVGTLTLDPTLFRPAPENVASKTSSITRVKPTSELSARATMLERVLKSVVTVDAGSRLEVVSSWALVDSC